MRFVQNCVGTKQPPCLGNPKRLPTLKGCGQSGRQAAFPWVLRSNCKVAQLLDENASGIEATEVCENVPCGKKTTPSPWFSPQYPSQIMFTPGGYTLLLLQVHYPAYARR